MIKCFFIEPTGMEYRYLRRYNGDRECKDNPMHYCDAMILLDIVPDEQDTSKRVFYWDHSDSRWPKTCVCGREFLDTDEWQLFTRSQYIDKATGKLYTLREAPEGAMWYADWYPEEWRGPDGHSLVVKVPKDHDWLVDGVASNCTKPGDKSHRCWIRHGVLPNITVDKNGNTCSAGGGSILTPDWHGFLRNGVLEP